MRREFLLLVFSSKKDWFWFAKQTLQQVGKRWHQRGRDRAADRMWLHTHSTRCLHEHSGEWVTSLQVKHAWKAEKSAKKKRFVPKVFHRMTKDISEVNSRGRTFSTTAAALMWGAEESWTLSFRSQSFVGPVKSKRHVTGSAVHLFTCVWRLGRILSTRTESSDCGKVYLPAHWVIEYPPTKRTASLCCFPTRNDPQLAHCSLFLWEPFLT